MKYSDYYIIVGRDDHGNRHFIGSFYACCNVVAWFKTLLFKHRYVYRNRFKKIYSRYAGLNEI